MARRSSQCSRQCGCRGAANRRSGRAGSDSLAVLGAATNGPSTGTVTLTYTDGSSQQQTLGLSDWTLNAGTSTPSFGNAIVATIPYRNWTGSGTETAFTLQPSENATPTYVFLATVPLNSGKTLASVTLPNSVNQGQFHIFDLGLLPPAAISSVTPSSAQPGQIVTINGSAFGSTQSSGYVHFADNGQNWGQPGNASTFVIDSWSDTKITFTLPVPSGTTNQWRILPNSTRTVTVVNSNGSTSQTLQRPSNTVNFSDYFERHQGLAGQQPRLLRPERHVLLGRRARGRNSPSITPGAPRHGGFTFTWPSPANCFYDDVTAAGQTILVPPTTGRDEPRAARDGSQR